MFYILYLDTDMLFNEVCECVINYFADNGEVLKNTEEELIISTDGLTLSLKQRGKNILFANDDYEATYTCFFWIDVIGSYSDWANDLMLFVNNILKKFKGDCVLESNGEKPFVMRKSGKLYVDKELGGSEEFPFYLLEFEYQENELKRD